MADIFVSYARSTEQQAEQIAAALRAKGYSVWRDDELPAHRSYAEVIEERIKLAKAVVVVWSADAAKSQWVRAEADAAREAGKLVQVSIDGTVPPMPFNQIQCADLKGWNADVAAAGWRKVESSVAALLGEDEIKAKAPANAAPRERSICVLPFANMSGDPEQEYFSDGISEDITTDLTKVSALSVTSRNTAFTYKGKAVDVCDLARKLGVSHVVEGSVRKAGGRVRISAQLIDGATGDHLWADRYDRDLTDIFAIQDEISEAIVAALKLKLLPEERKAIEHRGTTVAEAYNLYLMARQYWVAGNHGDRRREERVIRICRRATEIDPGYAQAWALMAIAQSNLRYGFEGGAGQDDGVDAAAEALKLDPTIAEAYCPLARRFAEQDQFDAADQEIGRAMQLNPESWEVNKEAARILFRQRRIEEAARHFEKAAEVMETDFHAWGMLFSCYQALGNTEGTLLAARMVLAQVETVVAQDPDNGAALSFGAASLSVLGHPDRAKEWIERAMLINPENLNMRYNFACNLAIHSKEKEAALDMLEPVFSTGGRTVVKLAEADPDMDSLRDHPRFIKMMSEAKSRIGMADPA